MYLDEFRKYRSTALHMIAENQVIKDLITNTQGSTERSEDLINHYIFPYEYLPGATEEGKTCITMLMSAPYVSNRSILHVKIVFYIFTYEGLMWANDSDGVACLRTDLICEEIDKMFNGSDSFGLKLKLSSRRDGYQPAKRFHGVQLIYETSDFNYKV